VEGNGTFRAFGLRRRGVGSYFMVRRSGRFICDRERIHLRSGMRDLDENE